MTMGPFQARGRRHLREYVEVIHVATVVRFLAGVEVRLRHGGYDTCIARRNLIMEAMDDELGRAPPPSDLAAPPGHQAGWAPLRPERPRRFPTYEMCCSRAPRRRARVRFYMAAPLPLRRHVGAGLAGQAAAQLRSRLKPRHHRGAHGRALSAYELARDATVRIEARQGHWNGHVIGVGTGFFVNQRACSSRPGTWSAPPPPHRGWCGTWRSPPTSACTA